MKKTLFSSVLLIVGLLLFSNSATNAEAPPSLKEAIMLIQNMKLLEACKTLFDQEFKVWESQNHFETKSDGSLVSDFEKAVEQKIGLFLRDHTPWAGFQGEEGFAYPNPNGSDYRWYIDPIDGTISFKNGMDTFGLTLTLVKNKDPIATLIYFPKLNATYIAYQGQGAFKNGRRMVLNILNANTIGKHHLIAHSDDYAFQMSKRLDMLQSLKKLPQVTRSYTDIYAYTLVAEGKCIAKVDAAAALWDLYPGMLLIKEVGGYVRFYPIKDGTDDLYGSLIVGHESAVRLIHDHMHSHGCFSEVLWHNNKIG